MSDYISRQAVIDIINSGVATDTDADREHVCELIQAIPSTDVRENRNGKWLCSDDMYEMAVCSICNYDTHEPVDYARANYHFCSNCGADNRGDTDD